MFDSRDDGRDVKRPVSGRSERSSEGDAVGRLELFQQGVPETGRVPGLAQRAEAAGWDGISLTDSQNLIGDPFIAMALGRAGHRARCSS